MSRVNAEVGSAANSYEILAKLAMGGMAEIFLARGVGAAGVERYVVLKRVLRHKAGESDFVAMFLDEARLAAQLQHPNIAQVYDIGKLGDSYFFTMEYVHGETVRNLLARAHGLRQHIPIGAVLSVIAGAAAGLQHAHDRKGMDGKPLGIVHRDVSPSNLMVSYEGTVKVVDFGVAKAAHREIETRSGTVKGKITYMSPEQCRGLDIDRRSDLFSLGIVMWEMLVTDRLFKRNSDFENMQAIVSENVPPPSQLRPGVPREIDAICMKLLAKSPADRYQTADELHEALEQAAVATGSALSASSLGRFMRELFGQRPEPWIELQSQMAHPEAHTVTNEPIQADAAQLDELDRQLSAIPLLSQRMTAQPGPAAHPMLTIPLRVQADVSGRPSLDNLIQMPVGAPVGRTTPMRAQTNAPATMLMPPAPVPMPRAQTPSYSAVTSGPAYPSAPTSASHAMLSSYTQAAYQPPPRRSLALVILAPAIVISLGVGLALMVNGSKKSATARTEPAPEAPQVIAMSPGADTTPPAAPAVAAQPAAAPPVAVAPATAPPAPDAPAVSLSEPPPAAELPGPAVMTPPPEPAHDKPARKSRERPAPPKDDVATMFKAARYEDVVDACAASSRTVNANAVTCTVAACKQEEVSKARRWLTNVSSSKRAAVIKECAGVLPPAAPKPPVDPCKRDPLACQH